MLEYHKTICFAFSSEAHYAECMNNISQFKAHLNEQFEKYPELFPKDFKDGWKLNGFTSLSKKTV